MSLLRTTALFLLGLLFSVGCTSTPTAAISEAEVLQFIEAYDRDWLAKDTLSIAERLDEQYVYYNSRGQIRSRQRVINLAGHPSYRVENMRRTEIAPAIHGSVAVVGTRWTATPYYQGNRYDDDQRCVLVLAKRAGAVQLISEHCTEILEE